MKVNIRLIYNRYNKLNSEGKASVYIEIAFNRDIRKVVNTKIFATPDQWNNRKKEFNSKFNSYIKSNIYLRDKINAIQDYELQLLNADKELTPELLDDFLNGKKDSIKYFFKFIHEEFGKESMGVGTFNKNRSIINKLERHSPKLTFSDVNYKYVQDVDNWLHSQSQITSLNTIANYHKIIKKYVNLAINLGYMKHEENPYNKFRVKKSPTTKINLTEQELETIEDEYFENLFVKKIQDMFLFSCYTGLRYSDIINLQHKHYSINNDEVTITIDRMVKTQKPVELPLNMLFDGKPLHIFNKYFDRNNKFLFGEPLTNQYINRELKYIARSVGLIHKIVTFHMARHTFGSLLAEKTNDPYLIKDLMGHSDIKMSMEYIHSSRKGRNDKLKKIDW